MRSSINISLPAALRQWIQQQAENRGFETASEFVRDVIRREREKSLRVQIDQILSNAMETPVSEMTNADWDDIRKQGRKLARRRKNA